jgi:sigma54-dependent transcription regulator
MDIRTAEDYIIHMTTDHIFPQPLWPTHAQARFNAANHSRTAHQRAGRAVQIMDRFRLAQEAIEQGLPYLP